MANDRIVTLHIQNLENNAQPFAFDATVVRAGCARHPDLARHLKITIGNATADFARQIGDAEILLTWTRFARENFPHPAPRLKWIMFTSAGLDRLQPFDWVPDGCALVNNRGTQGPKAAEYGLMALLMLNAHVPGFISSQQKAEWRQSYTASIKGKTLVVVGVGAMGGAIAEAAKALGLRVIGVRQSGAPHPALDRVVTPDGLNDVLPLADFVLLNQPLTPVTRRSFGRAQFALMKQGAGFVNVARGAVIDDDALIDALASGHLSGAVLDVFDPEPLPGAHPFWHTPNLVMTPHCIDDRDNYLPLTLDLFFKNFAAYLAGDPLPNRVDIGRGY
jgi:glyoxylate/hydroxypyruvate reductase A